MGHGRRSRPFPPPALAVLGVSVALMGAGCAPGEEGGTAGARVRVVASFHPLAEAARRVGGDAVEVTDLTPPGTEPHDIELTPRDVDAVEDADLVLVLGRGFQPAVEDAAARRDGPVVELLEAIDAPDSPAPGGPADPHVWLDPVRMEEIVDAVAGALVDADPDGAGGHRARAAEYGDEIAAVDGEYRRMFADCERDLVVTAHEAFGWLAARYELRHEGVAGISPEGEPDPDRLADLADLVRREGVTTVFTETLVSSEVAETLAREAGGIRTAVLDPLEGSGGGAGWASVMRANLAELAAALGCSGS